MLHMERRLRRLILVVAVLHALFLAVAPFGHHDFICHLKTPQHCLSCLASPLGSHPHAPASADTCTLADAGHAVSVPFVAESELLSARSMGRSPPPPFSLR